MSLKDFAKSGHPPTLFSAFLYFDVSFMVWVLLGVLGVAIAKDFGLTATQKGLLAAIPILGGALVRIPLGLAVDHIGPRRTGILAQVLVMIPLAGVWLFGARLDALLAFGLLLGIAGGSFAVAIPLASRWYPPEHQGTAVGIAGAGNSGTVLASLAAPRLAEAIGWRAVFGVALAPVAIALAAFLFLAKDSPTQPKPKKLGEYFQVLGDPDTLWFSFFYSVTFGGFVGLASFLTIFFHDQYGLSRISAGNLTALCVFVGSFARPIGGFLADQLGGFRLLSVLFATTAVLLAGISALPSLAVASVLVVGTMLSLGMGNGAVFQLVPLRFPKEIGVLTGIVGAAGGVGGFFLAMILGCLKDQAGTYGAGFLCSAAASAVALASVRRVQRARLAVPALEGVRS